MIARTHTCGTSPFEKAHLTFGCRKNLVLADQFSPCRFVRNIPASLIIFVLLQIPSWVMGRFAFVDAN